MNAVVIYDDFDLALKAKALLERVARRADEALTWSVKPWRLDMLIMPVTAGAALTDAANAHLNVLALRYHELLPAWLLDWLEQWAIRRRVKEAALAVWNDGQGDTLLSTDATTLSQFAERHGVTFMVKDAGLDKEELVVFPRGLYKRAVNLAQTPIPRPIAPFGAATPR